ncbi:hypothetical protein UG55_100966 [Frankia sp. EI5c]|nr:hypothetical protein UG55_100966 [Frankia sp. EI5c]
MLADACARAGFTPAIDHQDRGVDGEVRLCRRRPGVALVPSLAAWAVPAELALCPLSDPALRRTIYTALPVTPLPVTPLPAALTLRNLLATDAGRSGVRPSLGRQPGTQPGPG